jgi:hypothetical protein
MKEVLKWSWQAIDSLVLSTWSIAVNEHEYGYRNHNRREL